MYRSSKVALAAFALALSAAANASVSQVQPQNFVAGSGQITFSEKPLNTTNPTYNPADYGGGVNSPIVTFGGFFTGQSLSAHPTTDCPGGAATACVVGTPTGPLSLDPNSPNVFITTDGANPTSPVLSGTPIFNGPIAILFSTDQVGVGFDGGFFDAIGSTAITAFDRQGNLLGSVSNSQTGIQFLGLVTDSGNPEIAGVFLDLVGAEPAGFGIDNIRFGVQGQVTNPSGVPEPSTWAMMLLGFGGMGLALRTGKKKLARQSFNA